MNKNINDNIHPASLVNINNQTLVNINNQTHEPTAFLLENNTIIEKYNISLFFAQELRQLESYEICIICDDSGSMCIPVKNLNNSFETRWSEAQTSLKIITDIASMFDSSGIDIYYLNRPPITNVFRSEELNNYRHFHDHPNGFTPLGETIQKVLEEKKSCERNLLLIIFTDGQPNNLKLFMNVLENRKPIDKIFISIVACTDDQSCVGYLNNLDKQIKNLYISGNFNSEKQQIQKVQGSKFTFTFGDYITKILLGSSNQNIDKLDEVKLSERQLNTLKNHGNKKKQSCVIC